MAEDWDEEIRPKPFDEGRRQAGRLGDRASAVLKRSLETARRSRAAVGLWPNRRGERQYFDGFIRRLEEELRRRSAAGDLDAAPDIGGGRRPDSPEVSVSLDDGYDPVLRLQVDGTPDRRTPTDLSAVPEFLFLGPDEDDLPGARRSAFVGRPGPALPEFLTDGWIEETDAARGPRPGGPAALPTLPDYCLTPMDADTARGRSPAGRADPRHSPDLPEVLWTPFDERNSKPRRGTPTGTNGPAADAGPLVPIYILPDEPRGLLVLLKRTWAVVREAFRKPDRVRRFKDWDD